MIYQICWIRRASQLFGSTTHAVSTVVAVFFLGLALGSWVFGKLATRTRRPLRIYGLVEIGVGILAMLSLFFLDGLSHAFTPVYRALSDHRAMLLAVQGLLVAVVVLPPAVGMGGTLPLYCRQFVSAQSEIGWKTGSLYALNTLGAACGALATGLLLLPTLGLRHSVHIGVLLSMISGIVVLGLAGAWPVPEPISPHRPSRTTRAGSLPVGILFFVVGFVALVLEVVWVRFLALLVRNTVHTYTLTLGAVLSGIVVGSLVAGHLVNRRPSRAWWFGTMQVLMACSVMVLIALPPSAWERFGNETWVCFVALLPPSIFSGASFPLAVRMVVDDPRTTAINVGRLGAANIAGGILGALLAGWYALPRFGMAVCFSTVAALSLLAGLITWFGYARQVPLRWRLPAALAAITLWIGAACVARNQLPRAFLGESVLAYAEGLGSNLAVLDRDGERVFEIDRWWQGSDQKTHQIMAAHLPALLHPRPGRVLVVGAGTGQTARRFLLHDVRQLDCVDIEPAVFEFIGQHFGSDWMTDPRTRLIREDGRNYLRHTDATYDIISLEVGQIFRPGVAFFYTREFYQTAADHLVDGGLMTQFVPLPFFSPEQFRGVLRTFTEVFPEATLWYNTSELLLIGMQPGPLSVTGIELQSRLDRPAVREDLEFGYWGGRERWINQADNLLGGFLMGAANLRDFCRTGPLYTDDRPRLDYETRFANAMQSDETPLVDLLEGHLSPITDVRPDDPASAQRLRALNLADMRAQVLLRRVEALRETADYGRISALLHSALELNPANAQANRFMGDVLLYQSQPDQAIAFFDKALELRPDDARARYGRAMSLHRLGRLGEAIRGYRAAIAIRPHDAEYHNNLGAALGQSGQFDQAIQAFEEALRLRPDFTAAGDNLNRTRAALKTIP